MSNTVTTEELEDRFAGFIRLHRNTMHRYFLSIGMFNGHPHMLFHIRRHPGITQGELATHLEVSAASVAISIRRLESAGLVRRQRDEQDGRVVHLFLTDDGVEMDAACARGRQFMIDSLYRGLTEEEQATLYALLGKLTGNLQEACAGLPQSAPCSNEKEGNE